MFADDACRVARPRSGHIYVHNISLSLYIV